MSLRTKYGKLVDQKYTKGLTPEQEGELAAIRAKLDKQDEAFYLPLIKRLTRIKRLMLDQLSNNDTASNEELLEYFLDAGAQRSEAERLIALRETLRNDVRENARITQEELGEI